MIVLSMDVGPSFVRSSPLILLLERLRPSFVTSSSLRAYFVARDEMVKVSRIRWLLGTHGRTHPSMFAPNISDKIDCF